MKPEKTFKMFLGPMWSSKTTHLLMELEKAKYQKKKAVLFKPSIDTRYSETEVVSHAGYKWSAVSISDAKEIFSYLTNAEEAVHIVAVDEAFMLDDIGKSLIWLYRNGFDIIVSSLDLSAQLKPFEEIRKMLPWATHVEKLTSVCSVCQSPNAHFTYKKNDVESTVAIQVGGSELYEPRCHACHPLFEVEP